MRKLFLSIIVIILNFSVYGADLIKFWDTPQYGGNCFNRVPPSEKYYTALENYGATWTRVTWDKWKGEKRDFLIGDTDNYNGVVKSDLKILKDSLDKADKAGLKVVITPLSLPGMRWSQNNNGKYDGKIWKDKKYWEQSGAFWRELAEELKNHPSVAAYNIINEPAPEKEGGLKEHATEQEMKEWYKNNKETSRDLIAFYNFIIEKIREVDKATPIMVDAGWYAAADAFTYWDKPLEDEKVLYSFHMYEPYNYTSSPNLKREKMYSYPGVIDSFLGEAKWDKEVINNYLTKPVKWADSMKIPRNRVVAGEFGVIRRVPGSEKYLEDVLEKLDKEKIHWAFYSFREDSWDAMDYELGSGKANWKYWEMDKKGELDNYPRKVTEVFEPIYKRLSKNKSEVTN